MRKNIYDKANSILELRGINAKREKILKVIKSKKESLIGFHPKSFNGNRVVFKKFLFKPL